MLCLGYTFVCYFVYLRIVALRILSLWDKDRTRNWHYLSMQICLPFHWTRALHVTCKRLPTNYGLLMRNVVQLCLAANNILLMRK